MSRASVRTAVCNYFKPGGPGAIPNLLAVREAKPRNWDPADFRADPAVMPSVAAAYVYIEGDSERRGASGMKQVDYTVGLVFLFRSRDTDSVGMINAFDALVDTIKDKIHADHNLGSPGVIWQAGETMLESGTDDTKYTPAESEMWGVVRFDVTEWINA